MNISGHRFISYAYAGQLAGSSWGFNNKGLVSTMNALSARVMRPGLGTNFIGRDILDAANVSGAIIPPSY